MASIESNPRQLPAPTPESMKPICTLLLLLALGLSTSCVVVDDDDDAIRYGTTYRTVDRDDYYDYGDVDVDDYDDDDDDDDDDEVRRYRRTVVYSVPTPTYYRY